MIPVEDSASFTKKVLNALHIREGVSSEIRLDSEIYLEMPNNNGSKKAALIKLIQSDGYVWNRTVLRFYVQIYLDNGSGTRPVYNYHAPKIIPFYTKKTIDKLTDDEFNEMITKIKSKIRAFV
jgi:hypothetical protein